jgi:hypothetical protein
MLIKIAAVSSPRSLPKNIQFFLPIAHGRSVRSEELLSIYIRSSLAYRRSASH